MRGCTFQLPLIKGGPIKKGVKVDWLKFCLTCPSFEHDTNYETLQFVTHIICISFKTSKLGHKNLLYYYISITIFIN